MLGQFKLQVLFNPQAPAPGYPQHAPAVTGGHQGPLLCRQASPKHCPCDSNVCDPGETGALGMSSRTEDRPRLCAVRSPKNEEAQSHSHQHGLVDKPRDVVTAAGGSLAMLTVRISGPGGRLTAQFGQMRMTQRCEQRGRGTRNPGRRGAKWGSEEAQRASSCW